MSDAAADAPPAPKKSAGLMGTMISGIGIFVVSLGAVVAGGYVNAKLHPPPTLQLDKDNGKITVIGSAGSAGHDEGHAAKPAALFFPIDPPLVVNFEDGSTVRFLQITVEVMAHDQAAIDSVTKNVPLIRNSLLLLMSNRDYKTLMSREGKEALRQEALTEIRAVQKRTGGPDVDDLLFTTFVVQ